jgi:hypothetical protein
MKYNAKIIDSDNCYDALYTATVHTYRDQLLSTTRRNNNVNGQ